MTFIPRTATSGPQVKVGTGATMLALLTFLEQQAGGQGAARGYSFPHTPAPGNLTLGGVLAINAHGTAIPSPADSFPCSYGSLSNQILAFTAVVTDPKSSNPDQYSLRTFTRGEGDDIAFLTQLGRAFLVDATLQVIDNYNLRCQSYTTLTAATLFAAPSSGFDTAAEQHGGLPGQVRPRRGDLVSVQRRRRGSRCGASRRPSRPRRAR